MTGRVVPIWTSQDAVDTAQAFHMEVHNAERGESALSCDSKANERQRQHGFGNRLLFSTSRHRKARIYDGLAVTLLMVVMVLFGVVVFAASANWELKVVERYQVIDATVLGDEPGHIDSSTLRIVQ